MLLWADHQLNVNQLHCRLLCSQAEAPQSPCLRHCSVPPPKVWSASWGEPGNHDRTPWESPSGRGATISAPGQPLPRLMEEAEDFALTKQRGTNLHVQFQPGRRTQEKKRNTDVLCSRGEKTLNCFLEPVKDPGPTFVFLTIFTFFSAQLCDI